MSGPGPDARVLVGDKWVEIAITSGRGTIFEIRSVPDQAEDSYIEYPVFPDGYEISFEMGEAFGDRAQ